MSVTLYCLIPNTHCLLPNTACGPIIQLDTYLNNGIRLIKVTCTSTLGSTVHSPLAVLYTHPYVVSVKHVST